MSELPPYNSKATCSKCGGSDISSTHYDKHDLIYENREHMRRKCGTCSYEWKEAPLESNSPIIYNTSINGDKVKPEGFILDMNSTAVRLIDQEAFRQEISPEQLVTEAIGAWIDTLNDMDKPKYTLSKLEFDVLISIIMKHMSSNNLPNACRIALQQLGITVEPATT